MKNDEMNMMGMMRECMKGCRWCSFMPIVFGSILFLLGYFLDAEVVRILWLLFSGFIVLMGIFMFVMASTFFK